MIGAFDSGFGGLTVVRRLRERLPSHDLLFFADQAHVPYGERSEDELYRLLEHNLRLLEARGAQLIVAACNTSCAVASRRGWPSVSVPILDLIESAATAVQLAGYRRIGIVATSATAKSGAYSRAIKGRVDGAEVYEVPAPRLVPLVEAGQLTGPQTRACVNEVCDALPRDLDAVVLACTHYPMLDEHFAAVLGPDVDRVDPAVVQAARAAQSVAINDVPAGEGRALYLTNGDLARFSQRIVSALGETTPHTERLEPVAL